MYLTHLSLTNFRLFSRLDMDVPRRILLLMGLNAQGKTSLLESIYYLATFTSFHALNDKQLLNFVATSEDLTVARLVAAYQRGDRQHKLEVRLIQDSNGNGGSRLRKEVLLDGVKTPVNQVVGHFNAVIFLPQMTRILEGGPEERRRYLNLASAQADPFFTQALSEYNQAITQRNALLKLLAERGGDASQLDYWDEVLTSRGARIMHSRIIAIQEIEQLAIRIHEQLSGGKEVIRLNYQPSYDPLPKPEGQFSLPIQTSAQRDGFSLKQLQQGFAEKLKLVRNEEIARGVTTVGPHRDEMRIICNGIDLTDFGSRGQLRTAILSLKLAEVDWLKAKTTQWPVLLLDETLAELDVDRRHFLMDYLEKAEQAILTTTDLNLFSPGFVEKCERWQITSGSVSVLNS
ncbi:MAG: DNA replication and repair protein RecF [Anaerolineaceae bacterium]|nr:DNA replication and repair protein RecF [Anaerolineaceae bacterium]